MSEELLIQQCSPTLAGLKTGSMFVCNYTDESELRKDIRLFNRILSPKGLLVIPLRSGKGKALIYVFRPASLRQDLSDRRAVKVLKEMGYPLNSPAGCVSCLIKNIKNNSEFPHEIGLFLGYPPEDVIGFIENKATGHKLSGPWKVYGDLNKAKKTFARYKRCSDTFERRHKEGYSIESLAVAG